MRLQWTSDLDIDTLESKGHWARLEELLEVVARFLPGYESVLRACKDKPGTVSLLDLSFATKFLAVYLFVKVKGSHLMTYQHLTVEMVRTAKSNGGFIDYKNVQDSGQTWLRFSFPNGHKHAGVRWLYRLHSSSVEANLQLCFSHEEWWLA